MTQRASRLILVSSKAQISHFPNHLEWSKHLLSQVIILSYLQNKPMRLGSLLHSTDADGEAQ